MLVELESPGKEGVVLGDLLGEEAEGGLGVKGAPVPKGLGGLDRERAAGRERTAAAESGGLDNLPGPVSILGGASLTDVVTLEDSSADFNDTYTGRSPGHPSDTIPGLLALAEVDVDSAAARRFDPRRDISGWSDG